MDKKINYIARNFTAIKSELINYAQKHFPTTFTDFNDSAVGTLLLELISAVGDMQSFNLDKSIQETSIDFASDRSSILAQARTRGVRVPFRRPAITIVDFSVQVPVKGDTFDLSYAPLIVRGAQVTGGGQLFETTNDIDFSSPFNTGGITNRTIIPNFDSSGRIVSYTLTKRELVTAGKTKYFKRVITPSDVRPFLEVSLPDDDVLSVESIISLDGTNYNRLPTLEEQTTEGNIWTPVESLAQGRVFKEQPLQPSDRQGVMVGRWTDVPQRFVYEYTDNGFVIVRFGNGAQTLDSNDYTADSSIFIDQINKKASQASLGLIPRVNTTMFIKYRVGGGVASNIGVNTLNSIGQVTVFVGGSNPTVNQRVRTSLTVNNPVPALGGAGTPNIEELRNIVKYAQASSQKATTPKDYYARVSLMEGKFGVPYKTSVAKINNAIDISIISVNENGNLSNQSTNTLKQNVADYLENFKALNDFIVVRDGKIINIAFEFDLFVDNLVDRSEIATDVINTAFNFIQEKNLIMGQDVYLAQLTEAVNNVGGVLNVNSFRVFNKVGGGLYSLNEISQAYSDTETRQVDLLGQNAIFANYDEIFEIKYRNRDVKVRFVN